MTNMKLILLDKTKKIRLILSTKYNITNPNSDTFNYTGLCDEAVKMIINEMNVYIDMYNLNWECDWFHGEQKHSFEIDPRYWPMQHTWMSCINKDTGEKLYIDPTSQQFNFLYNDIPDFYISTKPPRWYYDDRTNPTWNGFTKVLNNKIKFYRMEKLPNGDILKCEDGIIEYIQYTIWGRICKIIRKILKKK